MRGRSSQHYFISKRGDRKWRAPSDTENSHWGAPQAQLQSATSTKTPESKSNTNTPLQLPTSAWRLGIVCNRCSHGMLLRDPFALWV